LTEIILELKKLRKNFGGVVAVDHMDLTVESGSITSMIGPNGAGKTTIFNLITGFLKPSAGNILYRNTDISGMKPHVIARKAIARTFQNVQVFPQMTVLENVMVGRHIRSKSGFIISVLVPPFCRREDKKNRADAEKWLDYVGLGHESDKTAGSLSLGNQRKLEIARALAMEPKIILLDEPASGLNARETVVMGRLIEKIRKIDITVVLVEHDMELVMDISDQIGVINFGRCIATGNPAEIQSNPEVIAAYLGE
jgi:branched-chain amino acid transport system ATP-binding protein